MFFFKNQSRSISQMKHAALIYEYLGRGLSTLFPYSRMRIEDMTVVTSLQWQEVLRRSRDQQTD